MIYVDKINPVNTHAFTNKYILCYKKSIYLFGKYCIVRKYAKLGHLSILLSVFIRAGSQAFTNTCTHRNTVLLPDFHSHNTLYLWMIRSCPLDSNGWRLLESKLFWVLETLSIFSLTSISSLGLIIAMTHLGFSPASILFIDWCE